MTKAKSSSLVGKIVAEAKASGELRYRIFLVKEQIKALHLQSEDDRAFVKIRRPAESWRGKDARRAFQDHRKYLIRMGYLHQQELDQLEGLSVEIETQLLETIDSLQKIR